MHLNFVIYHPIAEALTPNLRLDIDPKFITQLHNIPIFYNHKDVESTVRKHSAKATREQLVDALVARKTHLATMTDAFMTPSGVLVGTCKVSDRVRSIMEKMDISTMRTSLTTRVHKGRDEPLEISLTDKPLRAGCAILGFDTQDNFRARMSTTKTPEEWLANVKDKIDPQTYAELSRMIMSPEVGQYAQLVSTLPDELTKDGFNIVANLRAYLEKAQQQRQQPAAAQETPAPPKETSDLMKSCQTLTAKTLEHILGDRAMRKEVMEIASAAESAPELMRLVQCAELISRSGESRSESDESRKRKADEPEHFAKRQQYTSSASTQDNLAALFKMPTV